MSHQKPTVSEVATRIWEKIKQHPSYVLGVALVVFAVYPKPFLRLFRPLIRHVANHYDKLEYSDTETIVLSTRVLDGETLYRSIGLDPYKSLKVIDFLKYRAEQDQTAELWGHILSERIKKTHADIVVVLAQSNILQQCELSIYSMEQSERHKLNLLTEDSVHLLARCLSSYELKELALGP